MDTPLLYLGGLHAWDALFSIGGMPKIILGAVLKKKKLSKRQFAKRLGAQYHSVFQYFKPNYNPTFKTMCRWAKAAGVRVRDLIKE